MRNITKLKQQAEMRQLQRERLLKRGDNTKVAGKQLTNVTRL